MSTKTASATKKTPKKRKIIGGNTKFKKSITESSRKYLLRQAKDTFAKQARQSGYRSRAAFKLLHIQEKHSLIKSTSVVVDLGAAPGGWCQVVLEIFHQNPSPKSKLIATDLLHMDPVEGATIIRGDFTRDNVLERVQEAAGATNDTQQCVDVVLSDMAPNTTGSKNADHLRIMQLADLAADFALTHLNKGGNFACKLFMGGEEIQFREMLRHNFTKVTFEKPESSRKNSRELFIVALGRK